MKNILKTMNDVLMANFNSIPEDNRWNGEQTKELKMHRIHSYPAKFPAFITTQALNLMGERERPKRIADVFCGCGTVAFEAKRNNIDFWGCDINPVATLIARVKSERYNPKVLMKYYEAILRKYPRMKVEKNAYKTANERLKYWYSKKRFEDLKRLNSVIKRLTPCESKYRSFFICAFSNILKPTSRWLTKSIKPQIDPKKEKAEVFEAFKKQCEFMMKANDESSIKNDAETKIVTANFLTLSKKLPKVDMIITSPPYATSYEYADLHQLSSLWLNFAEDYRELRKGTIGSKHHLPLDEKEIKQLNSTGIEIVKKLLKKDREKARSVTRYFLDMQSVAKTCRSMLTKEGKALFVIGNTEFRGVRIENARHLSEALLRSGFKRIVLNKRRVEGKTLTPYRDGAGKFTTDKESRKVYAEEFIIIGTN